MSGSLFEGVPTWVGTAPQFALVLMFAMTLVKVWPIIQKNLLEARAVRQGRYEIRIAHLEKEVQECHEQCRKELDMLHQELWGDKRQRVQEQISLINTIISTVDAPELKQLLRVLESTEAFLGRNRVKVVNDPADATSAIVTTTTTTKTEQNNENGK